MQNLGGKQSVLWAIGKQSIYYHWKKDNKAFRPSDLREPTNLTDNFFIKGHIFT